MFDEPKMKCACSNTARLLKVLSVVCPAHVQHSMELTHSLELGSVLGREKRCSLTVASLTLSYLHPLGHFDLVLYRLN
jgi:hypothetical protein